MRFASFCISHLSIQFPPIFYVPSRCYGLQSRPFGGNRCWNLDRPNQPTNQPTGFIWWMVLESHPWVLSHVWHFSPRKKVGLYRKSNKMVAAKRLHVYSGVSYFRVQTFGARWLWCPQWVWLHHLEVTAKRPQVMMLEVPFCMQSRWVSFQD